MCARAGSVFEDIMFSVCSGASVVCFLREVRWEISFSKDFMEISSLLSLLLGSRK